MRGSLSGRLATIKPLLGCHHYRRRFASWSFSYSPSSCIRNTSSSSYRTRTGARFHAQGVRCSPRAEKCSVFPAPRAFVVLYRSTPSFSAVTTSDRAGPSVLPTMDDEGTWHTSVVVMVRLDRLIVTPLVLVCDFLSFMCTVPPPAPN